MKTKIMSEMDEKEFIEELEMIENILGEDFLGKISKKAKAKFKDIDDNFETLKHLTHNELTYYLKTM